jgi:hypothetical protein
VLKNNTQLRSTDMRVEREEWSLEDNPSKESQTFNVDVAKAFELQHTDPASYKLHSVWSGVPDWTPSRVEETHAGKLLTIHRAPFEVLTLSAIPRDSPSFVYTTPTTPASA